MKKVFLFLSAISMVAISCSSDDAPGDPQVPTDNVLVKKAIYQQPGADGFNFTIDYTYDGNKLVKETYDDGTVGTYFYTGNLITKIEYMFDGVLDQRELMTYNSEGKLLSYKLRFADENYDTEWADFVYNADNTVTETGSSGTSIMTYVNNELSTRAYTYANGSTYTYTYDSKNSPFKNVTGYAAIADVVAGDHELHGKARNITSVINQTSTEIYMTNTLTYNAANYPTMVKSIANFEENPGPSEELTVIYQY